MNTGAPLPSDASVFLIRNEQVSGPYTREDALELLSRGQLDPLTLASFSGGPSDWRPVSLLLAPAPKPAAAPLPVASRVSPNKRRKSSAVLPWVLAGVVSAVALAFGLIASNQSSGKAQAQTSAIRELEKKLAESQERNTELNDHYRKQLDAESEELTKLKEESNATISRLRGDLDIQLKEVAADRADLATYQTLADELLEEKTKSDNEIRIVSFVPRKVYVDVILEAEMLKPSKDELRKVITAAFSKAGYEIVEKEPDRGQSCLRVYFTFNDLPIANDPMAAYQMEVECWGEGWVQGGIRSCRYFHESNVGYAGKRADYRSQIRGGLTESMSRMVAKLETFKKDASAARLSGLYDSDDEVAKALASLRSAPDKWQRGNGPDLGRGGSGSGFLVASSGLIVTNAHVVGKHGAVEVWMPHSAKTVPATVFATDSATDLALLQIQETKELPKVSTWPAISKLPPTVGATVSTVGFPMPDVMGREPKFTSGVINALSGGLDDPRFLQHSVPIQPGNSGGPLLDANGQIVGIIQSTLGAKALLGERGVVPQNVNYAVKSDRLWDLAAKWGCEDDLGGGKRGKLSSEEATKLAVMIIVPEASSSSELDDLRKRLDKILGE